MSDLGVKIHDRLDDARTTVGSKIRKAVTPGGIWTIARTLLWLAPLTILVWYTAESSNLASKPFTKDIRLVAADGNKSLTMNDPPEGKISFTVYVTREQEDELTALRELKLEISETPESGLTSRRTRDLLLASPDFKRLRVNSVASVSPENLQIMVDSIIEKEVRVVPKDIKNLASAVFNPPTVKIRGPADALRNGGTVEAALDEQDVFATPGKKDPRAVKLRWTGSGDVQITPETVSAEVEIRESDVEYVVPSVPIFASLPLLFSDDFRLTINPDFVPSVKLLGPKEQIDTIRDAKYVPKARLEFTDSELAALRSLETVTKRPIFDLPAGVRVEKDQLERMSIECKATPRRPG